MLQVFPNPKSFGKTRQAHRQKFPDGAVALKPQNLKGNKIFRNEQGKGYCTLTCVASKREKYPYC